MTDHQNRSFAVSASSLPNTDPERIECGIRDREDRNLVEAYRIPDEADQRVKVFADIVARADMSLPDSVPELWQLAVRHLNSACLSQASAGMALLMLKERIPKGNFIAELECRNLNERTAREAMQIAKALLRMPAKLREKAHSISGQKVLALAKLPDEVLAAIDAEETIVGKPLGHLDTLSYRELREWVSKENQRHENKEADLKKEGDRQREEIADLKQQLNEATMQQLPFDEAEAAALRKLQQIEDTVRMSLGFLDAKHFARATPAVKLMAARIADYIESFGRFVSVGLRREHPECWEGYEPPTDAEIQDATSDHLAKAGRLRGKPISDLK